jgi:acyl-CoA thioesterase-2
VVESAERTLLDVLTPTRTGDDRFVATMPDWFGGHPFGGIVIAQSLAAALQTVDDPASVHSFHGYFLRPVTVGVPGELVVERVRDGRSFTTRQVDTVIGGKTAFRSLCSWHQREPGEAYQLSMPADVAPPEQLDPPLDRPGPPEAQFDVRDAGPSPRRSDGTYESTRRAWFRSSAALPDDPSAHLAIAAFVSDMTGTAFRPNNLGEINTHTDASLDHALWFHRPIRVDEWLLYDVTAVVNHGGRSVVRGSMYSRDGVLLLSMMQELLIRPVDAINS